MCLIDNLFFSGNMGSIPVILSKSSAARCNKEIEIPNEKAQTMYY